MHQFIVYYRQRNQNFICFSFLTHFHFNSSWQRVLVRRAPVAAVAPEAHQLVKHAPDAGAVNEVVVDDGHEEVRVVDGVDQRVGCGLVVVDGCPDGRPQLLCCVVWCAVSQICAQSQEKKRVCASTP